MAKTRSEITSIVEANTGRTNKEDLINSLYDNALKMAVRKNAFQESIHLCDDLSITEEDTEVSIETLTSDSIYVGKVLDVITARIVQADGTYNEKLTIKNRQWWIINVINAEDNMLGWPIYGMVEKSVIKLDRPSKSGLELRLQVSTIPEFGTSVLFTTGTKAFEVGEKLTHDSSSATGFVKTFTLSSGSWAVGNAAGTLQLSNLHGTLGGLVRGPDSVIRALLSSVPSYDNSECPIDILDVFLEQYATAFVFLSLEKHSNYAAWYSLSLDTLADAISKDKSQQVEDKDVETDSVLRNRGLAITDIDTGITKTWY